MVLFLFFFCERTILQSLVGRFEEDPLLGVYSLGLIGCDSEELKNSISTETLGSTGRETGMHAGTGEAATYRSVECGNILFQKMGTTKGNLFAQSSASSGTK